MLYWPPKRRTSENSNNQKGNQVEHANEAEVADDLFVIPNNGMGDHGPDHGKDEQAAGIKE